MQLVLEVQEVLSGPADLARAQSQVGHRFPEAQNLPVHLHLHPVLLAGRPDGDSGQAGRLGVGPNREQQLPNRVGEGLLPRTSGRGEVLPADQGQVRVQEHGQAQVPVLEQGRGSPLVLVLVGLV